MQNARYGVITTKSARKARRQAELDSSRELVDWYQAKKREITDATDLTDIERAVANRALMMEFGKRSKKAIARAKRENSLPKLLERQAMAEIEAKRAESQ